MFSRPKLVPVRGVVVLVVGVGSEIERLMALEAIRREAKAMITWDLNGETVEQTAVETLDLATRKAAALPCTLRVSAYTVDVAGDE